MNESLGGLDKRLQEGWLYVMVWTQAPSQGGSFLAALS